MLNNFINSTGLNWVDSVVLTVLFLYMIEGYSLGFLAAVLDLLSFILSFIIGLKTYAIGGKLIQNIFSISLGFSNALGFLIVASLSEVIIGYISRRIVYTQYFSRIKFKGAFLGAIDKFFGACVGVVSGLILFSFIFSLIAALPV